MDYAIANSIQEQSVFTTAPAVLLFVSFCTMQLKIAKPNCTANNRIAPFGFANGNVQAYRNHLRFGKSPIISEGGERDIQKISILNLYFWK